MLKLDLSYLQSISGGDKEFIDQMLNMFLTNTFPEITQLESYAAQADWEKMGAMAHKMKAPIQMLGVPEVSSLVLELEQMGKQKIDTDKSMDKVYELKKYLVILEERIKEIV